MEDRVTQFIAGEMAQTWSTLQSLREDTVVLGEIARIAEECEKALVSQHKILLAGNGGSAADAQHIAAEFISKLRTDRSPLPAIALTTDTSILTAIGNDYGYENVFKRQVEGIGQKGDVLIAISTSGNSPSILSAIEAARGKEMFVAGLTGATGGQMADLCHAVVRVPSARTPNIQEMHIMIGHIICGIAEISFLPQKAAQVAGSR